MLNASLVLSATHRMVREISFCSISHPLTTTKNINKSHKSIKHWKYTLVFYLLYCYSNKKGECLKVNPHYPKLIFNIFKFSMTVALNTKTSLILAAINLIILLTDFCCWNRCVQNYKFVPYTFLVSLLLNCSSSWGAMKLTAAGNGENLHKK